MAAPRFWLAIGCGAFLLAGAGLVVGVHQGSRTDLPQPIHEWNFTTGSARDVAGDLDGMLFGGAVIANGRLMLNGYGAYMGTSPDPIQLTAMTMVTWVSLSNVYQEGGSALSVVDQYERFDAIDFGEHVPQQWMAGSDYAYRSPQDNGGALMTDTNEHMMAITYAADGTITLYRDGQFYANGGQYAPFTFVNPYYLVGKRHPSGANPFLSGAVSMAEIFNTTLGPPQVAALYQAGVGTPSLWTRLFGRAHNSAPACPSLQSSPFPPQNGNAAPL